MVLPASILLLPCLSLLTACALGAGEIGDDDQGEGSGSGSTGGGENGGGSGPEADCPSVSLTTTRTVPSVQLLIDRSLSMGYRLDTTTNTSRFEAVGNAALYVVGQLQSKVHFGASLFMQSGPPGSAGTCPRVDSTAARKLMNLSQVQQLLQSFTPTGYTPTAAAFAQTAAQLAANPPPANSPPVIVLATDGYPNNCQLVGDPFVDTVNAIAAAHANGIRTFVLGIADVNTQYLQEMANAGQGVQVGQTDATYFTGNTAQGLRDAFDAMIGGVASCELALDGNIDPEYAHLGTVTLDGQPLKYDVDWKLVNNSTIRLEGAACTTLKTASMAHVEALFPCVAIF